MGQAFDSQGQPMGDEIIGYSPGEVLDELQKIHMDAAEYRILKLQESVEEIEGRHDELSREIVKRIDDRMGVGWSKSLAECLSDNKIWPMIE